MLVPYVRRSREAKGESLREMAEKAEIDFTLSSSLERGEVEPLKFDEFTKRDQALGMAGDILSLAWSAGEFHTDLGKRDYEKSLRKIKLEQTLPII